MYKNGFYHSIMEQSYFTFHLALNTCNTGELTDNLDASLEVVSARSTATSSTSPILLNTVKREVSEEAVEQDGVKTRHDSLMFKGNTESHSHVTSSTPTSNTEKKVGTAERSKDGDATNSKISTNKSTLGMN